VIASIVALEYLDRGASIAGGLQVGLNCGLLFIRVLRSLHINDKELPLEALLVAFAAFDHGFRIALGRNANQETFVSAENRLDTVRMNIRFQLRIDDFRSQQQREFPKFGKLTLARVADPRRRQFFTEMPQAKVCWHIHDDDVIGGEKKGFWNCFGGLLPRDGLNLLPVFLDMKQIHAC
jgi:hypothetical protein